MRPSGIGMVTCESLVAAFTTRLLPVFCGFQEGRWMDFMVNCLFSLLVRFIPGPNTSEDLSAERGPVATSANDDVSP